MTTLEPLTNAMIHEFLASTGLRYSIGERGDASLSFTWGPGDQDRLLVIRIVNLNGVSLLVSGVFQPDAVPKRVLLERCNEWNSDRTWPRVAVEDIDGETMIVADLVYPAATGTHQAAVADVCALGMDAISRAWRWFRDHDVTDTFEAIVAGLVDEFSTLEFPAADDRDES